MGAGVIVLASTTQVLRARLAAAVATTEPTFSFAWADDASPVAIGNTRGSLNGTANVNLVTAPAASAVRVVRSGLLYNGDTAPVTLTIEQYDGTNAEALAVITLPSGYTLAFQDQGFRVTNANGETLIVTGSGGTVTSVGMTVPTWLTVSGSPVTSSGTLAVSATTGQTANQFIATPNGSSGAVGLRAIATADLPSGVTQTIASGTASLGTSAIASGAKASTVTVTATGVASTDALIWGFNGDPTSTTGYVPTTNGMLTIIAYPSSGNVNFIVVNNTGASITPGAITLNWRVVR